MVYIFFYFIVAKNVLDKGKLEIDGYLLTMKPKRPEVIFPPDKKKMFIENINPKTSKDSLSNYIEIITKQEVKEMVLGNNNDAMATVDNESGKTKARFPHPETSVRDFKC